MSKYVLLVALLLFASLATAIEPPPYYEYVQNKLDKTECLGFYSWVLGMIATEEFGAPSEPFELILEEMGFIVTSMENCAEEEDFACFNSEYANFVTLAKGAQSLYLQYGIMHYLDGGAHPEDLNYMFGQLAEGQGFLQACYAGEEPID